MLQSDDLTLIVEKLLYLERPRLDFVIIIDIFFEVKTECYMEDSIIYLLTDSTKPNHLYTLVLDLVQKLGFSLTFVLATIVATTTIMEGIVMFINNIDLFKSWNLVDGQGEGAYLNTL